MVHWVVHAHGQGGRYFAAATEFSTSLERGSLGSCCYSSRLLEIL